MSDGLESVRELRWTKNKPTEPGIYLRKNPHIQAVLKHRVIEVDGKLATSGTSDHCPGLWYIEKMSDTFWWYGPIPEPPEE